MQPSHPNGNLHRAPVKLSPQLRFAHMTEEEAHKRNSVWSQFHSPVLENATVVELENLNPQDRARQVEIRKVRQSIEEMSILLAEMQGMYKVPNDESADDASDSPSDAYVTAIDVNSPSSSGQKIHRKPSPAFGGLSSGVSDPKPGPQRRPRVDTSSTRESMRASMVPPASAAPSAAKSPKRAFPSPVKTQRSREDRRSSSIHQRSISQPSPSQFADPTPGPFTVSPHDLPQPAPIKSSQHHDHHRHHNHPKGHALAHAQQTCRHPKSDKSDPSSRSSHPKRSQFDKAAIERRLNEGGEISIDSLDLPTSERKLLERFISALSKLSVEVQMDDAKRQEGRRRMNNALRALEGWI